MPHIEELIAKNDFQIRANLVSIINLKRNVPQCGCNCGFTIDSCKRSRGCPNRFTQDCLTRKRGNRDQQQILLDENVKLKADNVILNAELNPIVAPPLNESLIISSSDESYTAQGTVRFRMKVRGNFQPQNTPLNAVIQIRFLDGTKLKKQLTKNFQIKSGETITRDIITTVSDPEVQSINIRVETETLSFPLVFSIQREIAPPPPPPPPPPVDTFSKYTQQFLNLTFEAGSVRGDLSIVRTFTGTIEKYTNEIIITDRDSGLTLKTRSNPVDVSTSISMNFDNIQSNSIKVESFIVKVENNIPMDIGVIPISRFLTSITPPPPPVTPGGDIFTRIIVGVIGAGVLIGLTNRGDKK